MAVRARVSRVNPQQMDLFGGAVPRAEPLVALSLPERPAPESTEATSTRKSSEEPTQAQHGPGRADARLSRSVPPVGRTFVRRGKAGCVQGRIEVKRSGQQRRGPDGNGRGSVQRGALRASSGEVSTAGRLGSCAPKRRATASSSSQFVRCWRRSSVISPEKPSNC